MSKPQPIIGQKGVKYGLQLPKGRQAPGAAAPGAAGGLKKPPSVFGGDSDSEEETVGAQVQRQAYAKKSDAKVQDMLAKALEEDPNVFDYDAAVETDRAAAGAGQSLTGGRGQARGAAPAAAAPKQPRYIASILEQAQMRKREQEIIQERRLIKERQKEDHLYQKEEKFVTAAYRKKLEEDRKWAEEQRKRDEAEEAADPSKLGNMNSFYANLMTKNVAMGASGPSTSAPAATAATAGREGSPEAGNADGEKRQEEGGGRDAMEEDEESAAAEAAAAEAAAAAREKAMAGLSEYERLRLAALQAPERAASSGDEAAAAASGEGRRQEAAAASGGGKGEGGEEGAEKQPAAAAGVGGKRRNDADAVSAARERYLARKRQK